MDIQLKKDIFISYKNDGSGNQFATRLCQDLEKMGYSVYFNSNEERAHSFPERLKNAVSSCKDFILILSRGCLEQLKRHDAVDWVREEILTAKSCEKHIVPILMEGVELPRNADEMPEDLRFLPLIDAIRFPEQYVESPFFVLLKVLKSGSDGRDVYKDTFNSNPDYRVEADFQEKLTKAKDGDIRAMYEVGMMYFYGVTNADGTASAWDFEQAAFWLKKVAQSDHKLRYHALSTIGRMYYQGIMPREPQSYEKAFEYHCMAAPEDEYSASDKGFMLRVGVGCSFDYQTILEHYRENIRKGDDMAIMALAQFFVKYGKYEEAFDLYDSMEIVSPEADYQIGLLYRDGVMSDPPRPDYIQAAYYFRNAADNHHILAAYEYGIMCFRPSGRFRKNFRNAEKYLKIAADGGVAAAQYVLGYMYRTGLVKKDLHKAVEYLEKARAQSNSFAALELASIYQQPECRNYQRAFECAKQAADHGVGEGELILGNLLFLGRGCEADINRAYEMYVRAYEHGMYYARMMMDKIEHLKGFAHSE